MTEVRAIEAKNLTKYFGDFLAVDHINFDVNQREIFGFLDLNYVWKSTKILMLTEYIKDFGEDLFE